MASLVAEAGLLQKKLITVQARIGTGALTTGQYNAALKAASLRGRRPILNRPTFFRRANSALNRILVTSTQTPQATDLSVARREHMLLDAVAGNILDHVPPKLRAEAAAESDRVKTGLRRIPGLQDPSVVGRAAFLKTIKARLAALGLGALGLGRILMFAGIALVALIVILKFVV